MKLDHPPFLHLENVNSLGFLIALFAIQLFVVVLLPRFHFVYTCYILARKRNSGDKAQVPTSGRKYQKQNHY